MADPHDDGSSGGEDCGLSGGRTDVLPLAGAPHGARLITHDRGAPVGTVSDRHKFVCQHRVVYT
jgi:hypothetical protein